MYNSDNISRLTEILQEMPQKGLKVAVIKAGALNLMEETVKEALIPLQRKSIEYVNSPFPVEDVEPFIKGKGYIDTVVISSKVTDYQKAVDSIKSLFFMDMLIIFMEEDYSAKVSIRLERGMHIESIYLNPIAVSKSINNSNLLQNIYWSQFLNHMDVDNVKSYLSDIGIRPIDILIMMTSDHYKISANVDKLKNLGLAILIDSRLVLTKQAILYMAKSELPAIKDENLITNFMLYEINQISPISKIEELLDGELLIDDSYVISPKSEVYKRLDERQVVYIGPTEGKLTNFIEFIGGLECETENLMLMES